MLSGSRGRPSHEDYEHLVSSVLRREAFQLEDCSVLAQLPGVQQLARSLKGSVFPTGTAIRFFLDQAAHEVEQHAWRQRDIASQRIAAFLHIWYGEQGTTVAVAEALGVSRSHISHTVQRQALALAGFWIWRGESTYRHSLQQSSLSKGVNGDMVRRSGHGGYATGDGSMEHEIEVVIYREGEQWVAQALNVDISSFGDTPDEARAALREALELYFEDAPDVEVPEVSDSRVERLRV
jgi:predicted RNase H-like HicB family nuclease